MVMNLGRDSLLVFRCISFDADYDVLRHAIEDITNSSVAVARETISDPGRGYRYWVSKRPTSLTSPRAQ